MVFRLRLAALAAGALLALATARADSVDDARALLDKGEAAQALTRVDELLKKEPKDARARFLRGVILARQDKTDEAIAAFRSLNEDMPELPEPYNNLAVLYAKQGHYEEARRVLETAVVANPGYALAYENLGDIYARMAAQAYARAGKLDPKAAGAREKLKLVDRVLGQ